MPETKPKILIVDDEPNNHRVYQRILESLDLDIVAVMSGQKALEVAYRHDFFLILMDVQMPDMDGFETASLILDNPETSNIPVIFITAIAKDETFEFKGYKSGAVDYLVKPINEDILKSKINIFLELYNQHKQLKNTLEEVHRLNKSLEDEIEERKQIAMEKGKLEQQLRQSHKIEAIGTMAGGIAHDFNNILAAIIGYSDMALDDLPDSNPAKRKVEQVLKAGNRAKDLVRQILSFSRMSGLTEKHRPIFVSPVVKEVLKFQRSIIPTTISIISDIDENCGRINGDPTQVHQVIMNFCTNALHAMEERGGTLEVVLKKTELSSADLKNEPDLYPGTYIKLRVCDTGVGMAPELIDNIFDPYFTTKEVDKGSGMGLALVSSIAKNHGGFMKVESQLGKGSTFDIFFPKIKEDIIEDESEKADEIPTGTERILFVDDEEAVANVGKAILDRLGYSVVSISSSADALLLFQGDPTKFDLVVTDQTMPNITGAELAESLLKIRPDLPIIICTGYSSTIDEVKARKIGIKEYVTKPVSKAVIAKAVRKVLDAACKK